MQPACISVIAFMLAVSCVFYFVVESFENATRHYNVLGILDTFFHFPRAKFNF